MAVEDKPTSAKTSISSKTATPATKQKHRPSALSLIDSKSKLQDIAVNILSPGLNHDNLNIDQKSTIESAKSVEEQQRQLIAAKIRVERQGGDASRVVAADTGKRTVSTPTIIIEKITETGKHKAESSSPLPPAKRFKRGKAPPPISISRNSNNVAPSIQTAPIKNGFHGSNNPTRADFLNSSKVINNRLSNSNKRMVPLMSPYAQKFQQQFPTFQSPLASAFFAPRYYPANAVAIPAAVTPGLYNPYYRSMMMKGAHLNTPRNPSFGTIPTVPSAPTATHIQTPTSAINGPITPLNHGFQQKPPITTTSQNYIINGNESSTLSELNKKSLKESKQGTESLNKKNLTISNSTNSEVVRKSLQSPLASTIIKQTISTNKRISGGPKTPIHLQKSGTPHVTDVFPGEMTKFAPVTNQPISAREEHFDFGLYKEENVVKPKQKKHESITEEDEEDVESKAIEENSKVNIELELENKLLKSIDIENFKDYKIDLKLRTDFGYKEIKMTFEKSNEPVKKKNFNLEKNEFLKACEELWEDFAKRKQN